jgi:hypothetical protein
MQSDRSAIQAQLQLHSNSSHGHLGHSATDSREAGFDHSSRAGFAPRPSPRRLSSPTQSVTPCPVCRCTSVKLDEVEASGLLHLAECPNCEHRWTARGVIARPTRGRGRVAFVSASRLDAAAQA